MHVKVLWFLKRQHNELNQFHTEKKNLLTKRAAGIMWKCNNLWYLSRKTCTVMYTRKGIEKEVTRIDKNGEKITKKKNILYITIYWYCMTFGKLIIKSCQ